MEGHGWATIQGALQPVCVDGSILPAQLVDLLADKEETSDMSDGEEDELICDERTYTSDEEEDYEDDFQVIEL